jgi:hypothetical protein
MKLKLDHRIARPVATLLAVSLLCASLAACVVEPAQRETVVVHTAPPPPRVEVVPAPREGYVWEQGHWQWRNGAYLWEPGHWELVQVGYHWVRGHWDQRGDGWVWVKGHWAA